jgi:polysaccharide pyruvyl transferase WcaK-like protein
MASDVVISVGGDNFSEDYGSPKLFFEALHYAKRLGKKTVIWGASIGPFHKDVEQWVAILNDCDLITAREDKTVEYLKTIGCTNNVKLVSDPAFCMAATEPIGFNIPKQADKITVGIGISDLIPRYKVSRERYYKIFSEFVEYLAIQQKANVILVPHVINPEIEYCDDFRACHELMKLLPSNDLCSVLPKNFNATELKYCISQCDYFIGARTHSTIAGLSMCVPTGSIGYSVKAIGINMDMLGSCEYVLSHLNLSLQSLIGLFEKMKTNQLAIVQKLKNEVPRAKSRALQAGQYLADIIG